MSHSAFNVNKSSLVEEMESEHCKTARLYNLGATLLNEEAVDSARQKVFDV